jgi:hypothetical protein
VTVPTGRRHERALRPARASNFASTAVMSWEVSSVWMIPGALSTTAGSFTLYQDLTAGFGNSDRQSVS